MLRMVLGNFLFCFSGIQYNKKKSQERYFAETDSILMVNLIGSFNIWSPLCTLVGLSQTRSKSLKLSSSLISPKTVEISEISCLDCQNVTRCMFIL